MKSRWSRRSGIGAALLLLCVVLVACADDSSDRQFAGDEQTTAGPTSTAPPSSTPGPAISPTPLASPLSEEALFAVRGTAPVGAIVVGDTVYLAPASLEPPVAVDIDKKWRPWLVSVSPDGSRVAILASLAKSAKTWSVLIADTTGAVIDQHRVTGDDATAVVPSDVVTTGPGGLDWSPDSSRIAVALPTGGIYAIDMEGGDVLEMSPPRRVPRPGSLAWSHNGQAIAYTAQPDAGSGFGIYVAPVAALPLDPITVLRPDGTGNRSARDLDWTADDDDIIFVLERRETGGAGGDVMSVSATGGLPEVLWSTGMQLGNAGAIDIELSPDGVVLAILTNAESGWYVEYRQLGGASQAGREIGTSALDGSLAWTDQGVLVMGSANSANEEPPASPVSALIDAQGVVTTPQPKATPIASPVPAGSPVPASPVASPLPASPVASPQVATPAAR